MVVDVMNPSSSGRFPTTAMVHERYADIDRSPMYSNRPEPAPASARVAAPAACEPRKAPPAPAPRTAAPRTAGLASRARALAPIAEPIGMNLGMAFAEDGAEWLFPQATSNRDLLAQVQRETMERAYQEREMARWAAGTGRRFGSYNELLDYLASARRAGYTIDGRNYRVSYIESVGFPADAAFTAPYNGPTPEDIAVREARRYATSTTSDRRNTPGPVGAHARALLDGNPIRSIAPPARTPEQVREAFLRATSETPEQRIVRERGNRFYDDHNARPGSCANCHR